MKDAKAFLGKGIKFPPQVDSVTGKFKLSEYDEDIKEAIYIILMTQKGERAMLPDFGCNLQNYVYELPSSTYLNLLKVEIADALTKWEPRIINIEVDIDTRQMIDAKVIINISYVVRRTNGQDNLVFPYYLNEGNGQG